MLFTWITAGSPLAIAIATRKEQGVTLAKRLNHSAVVLSGFCLNG